MVLISILSLAQEAQRENDTDTMEALVELREELDELAQLRIQDLTGLTKEESEKLEAFALEKDMEMEHEYIQEALAERELLEDIDGIDLEDAEAVAKAENDDEVAAENIRLPFRIPIDESTATAADPTTPPVLSPADDKKTSSTARAKLRKKKSTRFNKGGAFHAQEFAKSLGKGSSARPTADFTPPQQ